MPLGRRVLENVKIQRRSQTLKSAAQQQQSTATTTSQKTKKKKEKYSNSNSNNSIVRPRVLFAF